MSDVSSIAVPSENQQTCYSGTANENGHATPNSLRTWLWVSNPPQSSAMSRRTHQPSAVEDEVRLLGALDVD